MVKFLQFVPLFLLFISCKDPGSKTEAKTERYNQSRLNRIATVQRDIIQKGLTGSNQVLIFKDGQIIYDSIVNSGLRGDENITDQTIFPLWSMTKPITTVAVMILLEEGKIFLDDPIEKHLPEMADPKCQHESGNTYPCTRSVTILDLLAHRSGWGYYPRKSDGQQVLLSDLWYKDLEDFSRSMVSIPLKFEPGSQYQYGINTSILGRLIEVITGKSLYEFLKDRILGPLEMHDTKFHLTDDEKVRLQPLLRNENGVINFYKHKYNELSYLKSSEVQLGGAGMVSTTKDYANFCQMLLNNGSFKGRHIISPTSVELIKTPLNPELENGTFTGCSTGFSLFILTDPVKDGTLSPKGIFGWGGYHGTLFWIDQKNNLFGLVMDRTSQPATDVFRKVRIATYQALN
ncbi:serine hydrolase domain-containing protein [Flagellimonas algicola]|uniref:Beta-lactamase family protein n=1 Tax=Flagellimonas algicola TaxID=2583815 RepID=A0ABY2WH86_9FLAO|nr:serine hydrolase domain-containing protein [Allomuricauda algicola]TMU50716.1 beta-lactamase family protein [Allomuricauda algicola]